MRFRLQNYLPRTGQTSNGNTGDDAYYAAGVRAAGAGAAARADEWVNNDDGTCTDHATGLMWVQTVAKIIPGAEDVHATNQAQRVGINYGAGAGNWVTGGNYVAADLVTTGGLFYVCAVTHTGGDFATDLAAGKWRQTVWASSAATWASSSMTWADALANCEALDYAGYTDWRLPNCMEYLSAIHLGSATSPRMYPNGPQTTAAWEWTSTTDPADSTRAIQASFKPGYGYLFRSMEKTMAQTLIPVRGGIVLV